MPASRSQPGGGGGRRGQGACKTTLAKLLAGFYEPTAGSRSTASICKTWTSRNGGSGSPARPRSAQPAT